jgi:hypothetical protein
MSLTICCIVAQALMGSLSCCAHSAGAPILKLNTTMSAGRYFVLNFQNSLFILAFNEVNSEIPQQFNGVGKPSKLRACSEDAQAWKKSVSPQKNSVDLDLEAHFAHLFQEELASTINLHLDRFR